MAGRELVIILAREATNSQCSMDCPRFLGKAPGADTRPLDSMILCRGDLQYPTAIVTAQRAIK
jgi:hypothetical protein